MIVWMVVFTIVMILNKIVSNVMNFFALFVSPCFLLIAMIMTVMIMIISHSSSINSSLLGIYPSQIVIIASLLMLTYPFPLIFAKFLSVDGTFHPMFSTSYRPCAKHFLQNVQFCYFIIIVAYYFNPSS